LYFAPENRVAENSPSCGFLCTTETALSFTSKTLISPSTILSRYLHPTNPVFPLKYAAYSLSSSKFALNLCKNSSILS